MAVLTFVITNDGDQTYTSEAGSVSFLAVTDTRQTSHSEQSSDFSWVTMKSEGSLDETARMVSLQPGGELIINAANGINVDLKQINSQTGPALVAILVEQNPEMAWLQQLSDQGDINWHEVQEVHERWSEESASIGGGAAAVIAIVVTVLTAGVGTGIVGALGATTTATATTAVSGYTLAAAAATQAVVTSAATQVTLATINNGGKLDRALSDLGQKDSLRGLGASALTAGLTVGVDKIFENWTWGREGLVKTDPTYSITKGFDLDVWQGQLGFATHSATNGLASAAVNNAIYGGSFSEHLRTSMESQGNDVLSALAFNWVGTFADNQTEAAGHSGDIGKYRSYVEGGWGRTALHATTGGIITEITSGDFATGFAAAGLNQALSDSLDNFATGMSNTFLGGEDVWRTAGSQLAGLTGALFVGGDLNQGSWIAKQADTYNRQLHKAELKLIADNYKKYAEERGISPEQALKELIYFATSQVDFEHDLDPGQARVAFSNDYSKLSATLFLNKIASTEGYIRHQDGVATRAFEATEAQYLNSFINRNHLHEIEDGFYGERQGLGRRPILNAYSNDIRAGGYYSALDQARTDSNNAMSNQAIMIFGGSFFAPAVFSATAFIGGQAALFANSPSAYFYSTAARVSLPVVDDIAYGVMGMPGSMFAGFGATGVVAMESHFASQFADDAVDFARFYGDDVGSLGMYGRGGDSLDIPQLGAVSDSHLFDMPWSRGNDFGDGYGFGRVDDVDATAGWGFAPNESPDFTKTLTQQKELSVLTNQTRNDLVNNFDSLLAELTPNQIDAISENPWTMRLFFGSAVETRVAGQIDNLVQANPNYVLSDLKWTGKTNAPQDFYTPDGFNFDITGGSFSSILKHQNRAEIDSVISYDSIPDGLGYKFIDWLEKN